MKEYAADMLKFIKSDPEDAAEYFKDVKKVTSENVMKELFKKSRSDGYSDATTAHEILLNPGKDLEKKYKSAIQALQTYIDKVRALTPVPRKKALDAIESQMATFVLR